MKTSEVIALRKARTLEEIHEILEYIEDDWQPLDYTEVDEAQEKVPEVKP